MISENNITDSDYSGLSLNCSDTLISGNSIIRMGSVGISISACVNVTIKQNSIVYNGPINGSEVSKYVGGLMLSNIGHGSVYVYENNITDNSGFGVQFDRTNHCSVYDNNIERNNFGIYLSNYEIKNNTDWTSSFGSENKVYNNNLANNQNVFVERKDPAVHFPNETYTVTGNGTDVISWGNNGVGNYWSDYNGQGNYVIDENNVDHHPLTQPVDISLASPPEPFPISWIIVAAVSVAVVLSVGLLVYFKKHKRKPES